MAQFDKFKKEMLKQYVTYQVIKLQNIDNFNNNFNSFLDKNMLGIQIQKEKEFILDNLPQIQENGQIKATAIKFKI